MMNYKLYYKAAKACHAVYQKSTDLGTTEYFFQIEKLNGQVTQILSIAGTNELKDWLVNFNLFSWKGIKIGAYRAAKKIKKKIEIDPKLPLLVCGHSKAGATAIAFKRLFDATYCVAFAPARCIRCWSNNEMENTTIFIDPDDIVSKVAFINFDHPICTTIKAPEDHFLYSFADHDIENWVEFTKNRMVIEEWRKPIHILRGKV